MCLIYLYVIYYELHVDMCGAEVCHHKNMTQEIKPYTVLSVEKGLTVFSPIECTCSIWILHPSSCNPVKSCIYKYVDRWYHDRKTQCPKHWHVRGLEKGGGVTKPCTHPTGTYFIHGPPLLIKPCFIRKGGPCMKQVPVIHPIHTSTQCIT